jgi:hypothetical protein
MPLEPSIVLLPELKELLQQLAPSADDRLVFIGDFIDWSFIPNK